MLGDRQKIHFTLRRRDTDGQRRESRNENYRGRGEKEKRDLNGCSIPAGPLSETGMEKTDFLSGVFLPVVVEKMVASWIQGENGFAAALV